MVFVNRRNNEFVDFSVCKYELIRELVYYLKLDIDEEDYGRDDEITKQLDKLLDDYLQHFDKQGWDFHKELFSSSFSQFRNDMKKPTNKE
jgi:hypothetical protein